MFNLFAAHKIKHCDVTMTSTTVRQGVQKVPYSPQILPAPLLSAMSPEPKGKTNKQLIKKHNAKEMIGEVKIIGKQVLHNLAPYVG